ncbi:hypothetical protein ACWCO0_05420 [Streptomyces tubercidicus]
MPLTDARELMKVFLQRLDAPEEGVREHQCVRNTPYRVPRGAEFTTLAVPYVQGQIKRFARDATWSVHAPRRLQRGTQPLQMHVSPSLPASAHTCGKAMLTTA